MLYHFVFHFREFLKPKNKFVSGNSATQYFRLHFQPVFGIPGNEFPRNESHRTIITTNNLNKRADLILFTAKLQPVLERSDLYFNGKNKTVVTIGNTSINSNVFRMSVSFILRTCCLYDCSIHFVDRVFIFSWIFFYLVFT